MKAEIQKILEMNKTGTLTDEQAAALLEELAKSATQDASGAKAGPGEGAGDGAPGGGRYDFGRPIADLIQQTIQNTFGASSPRATDLDGNQSHMSKVEPPAGKDFVFSGNSIIMSCVTRVELDTAEMSRNSVNAAKLDRLRVFQGKFSGCAINGSALDRLEVLGSIVEGAAINGSKLGRFSVTGDSRVRNIRVDGASVKSVQLLGGSELAESLVTGTSISELELLGSRLRHVTFQNVSLTQAAFAHCELDRVQLTGGDGWRWQDMAKARFENCRFENARFTGCRLKNTVIRNVTLKDVSLNGADLSGLTLDGNQEFLLAAGIRP